MSETHAVPSTYLAQAAMRDDGRPMCPACPNGRLQPFKVTIGLTVGVLGWSGADYLEGWVAVCVGAKAGEHYAPEDQPPCGFSLPMTPHQRERRPQ